MTTTGFVAQFLGEGDTQSLSASVARALLIGVSVGLGLWMFGGYLSELGLAMLGGGQEAEETASVYFAAVDV